MISSTSIPVILAECTPVTPSNRMLEALPFVLEYPVAPDDIPTYFLPDTILTEPVKMMFVYRSMSARLT